MKLSDLEASYPILSVDALNSLLVKLNAQRQKFIAMKMNPRLHQHLMHNIRKCEESLREELTRRQEK